MFKGQGQGGPKGGFREGRLNSTRSNECNTIRPHDVSTVEVGGDDAQSGGEEAAGGDRGGAPSGSRGTLAEQQREATAQFNDTWGPGADAEAAFQERCAAQHRRNVAASASSGAIGHINSEDTVRAALAPISRAALAPIREVGSADSASAGSVDSASTIIVTPPIDVRQGDNDTEDQEQQWTSEGRQGERQMISEGRQGNIRQTPNGSNIINENKKKKDMHNIDKNIAEVIRDNEELYVTIKKFIDNGIKDDDSIVSMINNMMIEGQERIV